jgi:hypothetical protein
LSGRILISAGSGGQGVLVFLCRTNNRYTVSR